MTTNRLPDGEWYVIQHWVGRGRAAGWGDPDMTALYDSEGDARRARAAYPSPSTKTMRITIHNGSITTRRQLQS